MKVILREGEPCSHRGCLNHISHPCEGCGRVGGQRTLEFALETYRYGFDVTYDGDKNKILYGTYCNRCGKGFEDEELSVYCRKCRKEL